MNTINQILAACAHQVSACHQSKARDIDRALQAGIPFTAMGGKRMRCTKDLLRFKIGTSLRLIYQTTENGYMPRALITRQRLERHLKRR